MSQPIHHHQTFLHYTPPGVHHHHHHLHQQPPLNITHVAPKDTQTQSVQGHQQQSTAVVVAAPSISAQASGPVIAKGDWTKDLVHLAKTAELKKHALTLQLHTAHILSAHANLEQKSKAIQDLLEQKNRLESERTRLLNCLREINEDRDKVDLMEAQLKKECNDTRAKIEQLTSGDYAIAKSDVDSLRAELGQPPMPSLQETLEERNSHYLTDRRLNGNNSSQTQTSSNSAAGGSDNANSGERAGSSKRSVHPDTSPQEGPGSKRPRGRPKGSKNRSKSGGGDGTIGA